MLRSARLWFLGTALAALLGATIFAVPSQAATDDGNCQAGEYCVYKDSIGGVPLGPMRDTFHNNYAYSDDTYINVPDSLNDSVSWAANISSTLYIAAWEHAGYNGRLLKFFRHNTACNPSVCWYYDNLGAKSFNDIMSSHHFTAALPA